MATQEELRIILKTIADNNGADQVRRGLTGVRQEAQRSGLNRVFDDGRTSALGLAGALTSVQVGLATVSGAASTAKEFLASSLSATIDAQRVARATAAAYGEQSKQFERFAVALSAQTGFTSNSILEAALSARTLSDNYGLTIQQTQRLISVSADLARIRGIGVAESFERVQSAIRGEAEASEFLGLTLNATFLQQNAANGAYRQTFTTLTDAQRAQVVYAEVLRQTEKFSGLAADANKGLEGSFRTLDKTVLELKQHLGEVFSAPAQAGAGGLTGLVRSADDLVQKFETLQRVVRNPLPNFADVLIPLIQLGGRLPNLAAPGGIADPAVLQSVRDLFGALDRAQTSGLTTVTNRMADFHERVQQVATGRIGDPTAAFRREQAERNRIDQQNRRLQEINQLPTRGFADEARRVALLDQIDAAARGVVVSQREQEQLQRQSVALLGEEARIKLRLLPTQERLASLQRDITDQQARARLASLPVTEALEDTQNALERARLVFADRRGQSADDRRAAIRQMHDLRRNVLPGQELAAFDARASLVASARAGERVGLQGQIIDVAAQGALAGVGSSLQGNQLQQQIVAALVDSQKQVLKDIIDAAKGQPIQLVVNITDEGGTTRVVEQLIEAAGQARTPPIIQLSGVR